MEGATLWDLQTDQQTALPNDTSVVGFDSDDRNLILADRDGLLLSPLNNITLARDNSLRVAEKTVGAGIVSGEGGWGGDRRGD